MLKCWGYQTVEKCEDRFIMYGYDVRIAGYVTQCRPRRQTR